MLIYIYYYELNIGIGLLLGPGCIHLGPWYIAAKDPFTNTVYATNNFQIIESPRMQFRISNINWINN